MFTCVSVLCFHFIKPYQTISNHIKAYQCIFVFLITSSAVIAAPAVVSKAVVLLCSCTSRERQGSVGYQERVTTAIDHVMIAIQNAHLIITIH